MCIRDSLSSDASGRHAGALILLVVRANHGTLVPRKALSTVRPSGPFQKGGASAEHHVPTAHGARVAVLAAAPRLG
eukprot:7396878-Alexandrium_andersonii.AAC.1